VPAEQVAGVGLIDVDGVGAGGDGDAEGVDGEDGGAEEEAGAGHHEETGDRTGALGETCNRAARTDGGFGVAPGPNGECQAAGDEGDSGEAKGSQRKFRDFLPAFEGDQGCRKSQEPEARGEAAGQVEAVKHREGLYSEQ